MVPTDLFSPAKNMLQLMFTTLDLFCEARRQISHWFIVKHLCCFQKKMRPAKGTDHVPLHTRDMKIYASCKRYQQFCDASPNYESPITVLTKTIYYSIQTYKMQTYRQFLILSLSHDMLCFMYITIHSVHLYKQTTCHVHCTNISSQTVSSHNSYEYKKSSW